MKFAELQLHPLLQTNLDKIGFTECTPIQEQAIPLLRQGKDLSGLAQTGTGKTGAFLLPLIDRLLKVTKPEDSLADTATVPFPEWKTRQYILVLVPTRELCEQVQENAQKFLEGTGLRSVSIYGGTTYEKQIAALKDGVEFVVATPGRFIDLHKEHIADLGLVRAVIFDEADRMFDMGFKDDMKFLLRRMPRERQFLVFSATLNFEVLNVAYEYGAEPVEVNISRDQAKADNVTDHMIHLGGEDKPRYLLSLLKKYEPRQAIIFSNFKHNVERIAQFLSSNGVPAMGISSLLTQAQRNRVMAQFKAENEKNILVATDVAARGLDILGVDLVVNYDLPDDPENYVHRIGRTGRAGQVGQAFSMVSDRDVDALQRVEQFLGNKLEVLWLDDTDLVQDLKPFPRDEGHRGPRRRPEGRPGERPPRRDSGGRPPARGAGPRNGPGPREGGGPTAAAARPEGGGSRGPRRESHRDRHTGRHREGQNGNPQANGAPRAAAPAGQTRSGEGRGPRSNDSRGSRAPSAGGNRDPRAQQSRRSGQPPRVHSHRPKHATSSGPVYTKGSPSLGGKVSGFLKRLFGGK